ncbi:MAG: LuxR C-terminal-related transcriptional regulator, partial [Mycobacterium sp.]
HPLIPSGVTSAADPCAVRRAHRRLAGVVAHQETRARHLALSSPHGDAETLAALDAAAESSAARGVYTTAAELLELAIRLGGDNQWRRLRGADFHFRAGALDPASALLEPVLEELPEGFMRTAGLLMMAAIRGYREGLASTTGLLQSAAQEAGDDLLLRTQALMLLATAVGISGDMAASVDYARRARTDADATGLDELRSQALSVWLSASIIDGLGFDTEAMEQALTIGDPGLSAPIMFRPTTVFAQTCAWTGRLGEAREAMAEIARGCAERGNELDLIWAAEQLTMIDVFLGRYIDAERTATDAVERARQSGGRLPLINAYTAMANVAAHRGRVEEAQQAADLAIEQARAGDMKYLIRAPIMSVAFALVSDGRYEAALETLKPLLENFDPEHGTEIMTGAWLPDAAAALAALDRAVEAEPLVTALEANGVRHDRPWMLAVGARSRAVLLAVEGDLDAAIDAAEQAMVHHDRLPMPLERARTQLLLGQLQRRRRRLPAAQNNVTEALAVFTEIGSQLWTARAERELSRLTTRSTGTALTDSEKRVAELAASGMSNKQIAADLFLSAKTVEMYLTNAYRKLGIRSRTQLSGRLRDL